MQRLLRSLGRLARPFIQPDWEEERRTLAQIRARVDQLAAIQETASRHHAELTQLRAHLDALANREEAQLRKSMTGLRRAVLGHTQVTARALRRVEFLDEQAVHEHALQRIVDRAVRTGRPILAGPWTGEIGFELLYWIPFLRTLKARVHGVPMTVLSRGGVESWYEGIASGYHDIFSLTTPADFRAETERETRKQRTIGAFDRRLIRAATRATGLVRPVLVHPSLMYNLLYPYWKDQLPLRRLFEYLEPAALASSHSMARVADLPPEYIAVRFYFSHCFPDTPANRDVVNDVLRRVAAHAPVVLLNMPFAVDDHVDATLQVPGVHSVASLLTPENNLAIQTAVIRQARAFVGTYGGFSYLAPLCGVPSVTFYSDATFFEQHLEFARRTFSRVGAAPFVVLHEQERALVNDLAGARTL